MTLNNTNKESTQHLRTTGISPTVGRSTRVETVINYHTEQVRFIRNGGHSNNTWEEKNNVEISWNRGTPQSSFILIGHTLISHPFWGSPISGNRHISQCRAIEKDWLETGSRLLWFVNVFPALSGSNQGFVIYPLAIKHGKWNIHHL